MSYMLSSGHSLKVRGAGSYIDEVNEARKVVDKVASFMKDIGVPVETFHDNTSTTQSVNLRTIVKAHNSKKRSLHTSVHFNAASKTTSPRGVEVLYLGEANRAIAEKVSAAISKVSGLKNRGAKQRKDLYFLNSTIGPAILIEVCFVDSKADTDIYKAKFNDICKAIAESITGKKLPTKTTIKKEESDEIVLNSTGRKEAQELIKRAAAEGVFDAGIHTDAKVDKYSDGKLVSYVIAYVNRTLKK